MDAVALTLLLCAITGISRVFLKKGIEASNTVTAMVFSLVIGLIVLLPAAGFTATPDDFNPIGLAFFAFIGMIAPPVVRYLTYLGVDKLGASRSDPVRSLTPFFAILFAVFIFDESVTIAIIAGAVLIFAGIVVLTRQQARVGEEKPWRAIDLIYPLIAAVLAGLIANGRKFGSTLLPSPVVAAATAALSGALVFGAFVLFTERRKQIIINRRSGFYFLLAGICTSLTDILDILVLKLGKVSVVSPLLAASPLFVILFSHLFLKGIEKVTLTLVTGAVMVFFGMQIIMFYGVS